MIQIYKLKKETKTSKNILFLVRDGLKQKIKNRKQKKNTKTNTKTSKSAKARYLILNIKILFLKICYFHRNIPL